MLAIARSLATLPKYLLIDEALEGLAPIVVERFRDAIKMMKERDIGIVIAAVSSFGIGMFKYCSILLTL
ncbi:MAG: hypothetical protein QW118_07865 [Nitrososphaerota archaeon]